MRTLLPILIAVLLAANASAGGRRRAAVSAPRAAIAIAFVNVTAGSGADALLDAGSLSRVRRHTFGIRLDGPGKTATLRASLETLDARCIVRVDGIALGTAAKVIAAHAPLGGVTTHTLEIEVPPSVPEGAFSASVRWEASTD
jgi:hypothetical protein